LFFAYNAPQSQAHGKSRLPKYSSCSLHSTNTSNHMILITTGMLYKKLLGSCYRS